MKTKLLKYLSIVALLIFISPAIIENIHDLVPHSQLICHAQNEKHFHQESHHCVICGIKEIHQQYFLSTEITAVQIPALFSTESPYIINKTVSNVLLSSLRAPPGQII